MNDILLEAFKKHLARKRENSITIDLVDGKNC